MNKFPFSALGTQQLLDQLYTGDPGTLQQEAQDARQDLKAWLQKWFDLEPQQQQYLSNIPGQVIDPLARQIGDCLSKRTAISLRKPLPPQPGANHSSKAGENEDCDPTGKILIWERETGGTYTPGSGYGEDDHLDIALLCPEEP